MSAGRGAAKAEPLLAAQEAARQYCDKVAPDVSWSYAHRRCVERDFEAGASWQREQRNREHCGCDACHALELENESLRAMKARAEDWLQRLSIDSSDRSLIVDEILTGALWREGIRYEPGDERHLSDDPQRKGCDE